MTLSLSLAIQSLIFRMLAMFEECSLNSSWGTSDTYVHSKSKNGQVKQRIRAMDLFFNLMIQQLIVHMHIMSQDACCNSSWENFDTT